jgi:anti-sigma factor ChrR (cupin superfamily)|tara:strand:- start:481 stop:813 length:333 start_codon:yes stop_codon:yes gene_type:complete
MDNPLVMGDLMDTWQDLPFAPFREGVDVHYIKQGAPALAILRYAPGAKVPHHLHTGLETILVLDGMQSDERGDYAKGTLILNPEGTTHSVWSEQGCAVLIQWERPVQILE